MIDFHISYRSSAIFEALSAASPKKLSPALALERLHYERELPADTCEQHLADWIAALDAHGVSNAVACSSHEGEIAFIAESVEKSNGRLKAFAPFNPTLKNASERAQNLLAASGFTGVILDPAKDGYLLADKCTKDALDSVEYHGGIAIVRCGLPERELERAFGIPTSFDPDGANPLHLIVTADRHPNLNFVVQSFGGGYFRELLLVGTQCRNIWVDTSTTNDWIPAQPEAIGLVDVLERTVAVFGHERVLFGSGSSDPRKGWDRSILTSTREALGSFGTSAEECERIFDGNARQLLGIPVVESSPITQTH